MWLEQWKNVWLIQIKEKIAEKWLKGSIVWCRIANLKASHRQGHQIDKKETSGGKKVNETQWYSLKAMYSHDKKFSNLLYRMLLYFRPREVWSPHIYWKHISYQLCQQIRVLLYRKKSGKQCKWGQKVSGFVAMTVLLLAKELVARQFVVAWEWLLLGDENVKWIL